MISITKIVEIENFLRIMKERIKTEKFKAEKLPRPKILKFLEDSILIEDARFLLVYVCVCVCVGW